MPEWLERAKNDYLSRRVSRRDLDEMHDAVRKAAIKDQEVAGVDIVSRRRGAARQHDRLLHRADARRAGRSRLEALLLRLLRERGALEAGDRLARPGRGGAVPRPLHRPRAARSRSRARTRWSSASRTSTTRREEAFALDLGARAQLRAEGAGARRRHAAADRRAVLLGVPRGSAVGAQGDQRDGRRRERATSRCTSATATATASRRSRAATGICSRRSSRPRSRRCRWSSRAAAKRTCSCSRSSTCRSQLGLGVIDVKTQDVESAGARRRPHPPRARGDAGRAAGHQPRLRLRPPAARRGVQQAERDGRRHAHRPQGTGQMSEPLGRRAAERPGAVRLHGRARRVGLKREAQVLEIAVQAGDDAARSPAGSVTSYAGGAARAGLRCASARRCASRGLTPNVHLTCVGQDRKTHRQDARDAPGAARCTTSSAISGDWPKAALTDRRSSTSIRCSWPAHIAELRRDARHAVPHLVRGVAVQVPARRLPLSVPEARKEDRRRRRHGDHAGGLGREEVRRAEAAISTSAASTTPLLGNVYVLGAKAAERMSTGNPPGCWASPELVAATAKESEAPDRRAGRRASSAPRMTVAILKGIGYAGAYIGGTHDAEPHRADHPARRGAGAAVGGAAARSCSSATQDGFYLYERDRASRSRRARSCRWCSTPPRKALPVPWVEEARRTPPVRRAHRGRLRAGSIGIRRSATGSSGSSTTAKKEVFGCQNCGNCVLGQHGIRVPADLPEADAQRPVRRHVPRRSARSSRAGVHLGEGDGAGRSVEPRSSS